MRLFIVNFKAPMQVAGRALYHVRQLRADIVCWEKLGRLIAEEAHEPLVVQARHIGGQQNFKEKPIVEVVGGRFVFYHMSEGRIVMITSVLAPPGLFTVHMRIDKITTMGVVRSLIEDHTTAEVISDALTSEAPQKKPS